MNDNLNRPESAEPAPEGEDRRELIKKLGKAATLPLLIATFVATGATDAAATP